MISTVTTAVQLFNSVPFFFCVRLWRLCCRVRGCAAQCAMGSLATALLFSCGLRLCSIKTRWVDSVRRRDCRTYLQRYFNCSKPFPKIVGNVEGTNEFQFRKKRGPFHSWILRAIWWEWAHCGGLLFLLVFGKNYRTPFSSCHTN